MAGILDDIGPYLGIKNENDPLPEWRQKLDYLFGIQGSKWPEGPPREMQQGETIEGEISDVMFGADKNVYYIVTEANGDKVLLPQSSDMDFQKGDDIEATRSSHGYEAWDNSHGMGR